MAITTAAMFLAMLSPLCASGARADSPRASAQNQTISILDEVGQLSGTISNATLESWKAASGSGAEAEIARLNLAEYKLAHDQDPEDARTAFAEIEKSSNPGSATYATASFDSAIALYY